MTKEPCRTSEPAKESSTHLRRSQHCGAIIVLTLGLLLRTAVQLRADSADPAAATNTMLMSWSWNDSTNWTSDWGFLPLGYTNLAAYQADGVTALVVDSTNATAYLKYKIVEDDGTTTNLNIPSGSAMFWIAPDWTSAGAAGGSGPGQYARLLEIGSYTTNASFGWMSLYFDPAGTNIFFSSQSNGFGATYLSTPISWTNGVWNFLVLNWSSTNCALYQNGTLLTNGPGLAYPPGPDALTNGFSIGSDGATGLMQSRSLFHDLYTYNRPLSSSEISADYLLYSLFMPSVTYPTIDSAPPNPTFDPVFKAFTGLGRLTWLSNSVNCVTSSNVWITNVTAKRITNGTINLVFTIAGGSNSVFYDFFATPALKSPITNGVWSWMGQGTNCSVYLLTNLPSTAAFFLLGNNKDSDQDGLTDTYELLVSHTDPLNPDSDGDGLIDGWEIAYGLDPSNPDTGNTGVPDAYKDPAGDGWSNLYKYEHGMNPGVFYTPPPPRNVTARVDSTGTNVTITWSSGGGPVTNYAVVFINYAETIVGQVGPSTFTFAFNQALEPIDGIPTDALGWIVRANFSDGSHADSPLAQISKAALDLNIRVTRGPLGQRFLVVQSPPANLSRVLLYWPTSSAYSWTNIYATNLVNGVALIPFLAGYSGGTLSCQAIATNRDFGQMLEAAAYPDSSHEKDWTYAAQFSFVDARIHLKENLKFLLRSATVNNSFSYASNLRTAEVPLSDADASFIWSPEVYYARPQSPPSYEYSGYHVFSSNLNFSIMQELRPIQENYLWRNFVYDPGNYNSSGYITNGLDYDPTWPNVRLLDSPPRVFSGPATNTPALALAATNSPWLYGRDVSYSTWDDYMIDMAEVGLLPNFVNSDIVANLPAGVKNLYGLAYNSVQIYPANGVASAGGSQVIVAGDAEYFPNAAIPAPQTVGYYFASQTPYLSGYVGYGTLAGAAPPMPGSPTFNVTNTAPLLITGIGQPVTVSGWAKMAITNGYSGKYAYLEQYFDKAYKINSIGVVTTNQTGVLSPYGEFFPTDAGPVALVTMPDIDTGQRGTGIVSVIKLQLDVNHDGTMDLSYSGRDNTSPSRPFVFWLNNDDDFTSGSVDPLGHEERNPYWQNQQSASIACPRDLEDYSRLWISGVPALSSGTYQVTLGWRNISSGSPAIKLFQSVEGNGGILYLTDTNTAIDQVAYGPGQAVATISGSAQLTLPAAWFTNAGNKYFLFEGATNGTGELVLTVSQGTNVIAQTSTWLDLHDIQDLFDQTHIENITAAFPGMRDNTNASVFKSDHSSAPAPDEAKQMVVLLHGFNNDPWQSENYAETMFKRLYWQGYQGRFAALRWPTRTGLLNYNYSEYIAFRSGAGASDYFNSLRSRFPDYSINAAAHSMGNIVMMEALKLQVASGSNALNNYVMMEAAVPAHCYDTNAPVCPSLYTAETPPQTPNTYLGYPGAINAALRAGGQMANFFNTNDFALAAWVINEAAKPQTPSYYIVPNLQPYLVPSTPVTDAREIMAFCARPRSYAVGAQPGVQGVIAGQQVDLNATFGFDRDPADHSGQWTRSIQQVWGLYTLILQRMGLQ